MKYFISSTFEDLKEYRRHTINYLKELTAEKTSEIGAMEYFAASEYTSKEVCLAELESSDIVIGIYGSRFGWEEKSTGRSMTEIEFDKAVELGKPILGFVTYKEKEEKQQRFISEKVFVQGKNCGRFNSLKDYADVLHKSVKAYLRDTEGFSYKSIWDDIFLLRQIIEEDIGAGSLRMHIYEDGGEVLTKHVLTKHITRSNRSGYSNGCDDWRNVIHETVYDKVVSGIKTFDYLDKLIENGVILKELPEEIDYLINNLLKFL